MINISVKHKTDLQGIYYQTGFVQEFNIKGRVLFPEARVKTLTVRRGDANEPIEQLLFMNIKLTLFTNSKLASVFDSFQLHSIVKVRYLGKEYKAIERPQVKRKEKINGLWQVDISFPYAVNVFNELMSNEEITMSNG